MSCTRIETLLVACLDALRLTPRQINLRDLQSFAMQPDGVSSLVDEDINCDEA